MRFRRISILALLAVLRSSSVVSCWPAFVEVRACVLRLAYYVCAIFTMCVLSFSLPGPSQLAAGGQLQPPACLLQQISHLTPVTTTGRPPLLLPVSASLHLPACSVCPGPPNVVASPLSHCRTCITTSSPKRRTYASPSQSLPSRRGSSHSAQSFR